ncbi:MAG: choice-of-anchor L domain-containing protein, partial [Bacteroidia bacterium]|nr:choice-of-anchor L domain-containing protein [Bacteroidia bacterium]
SCTADGWTMPQALVLTTDSLAGQTVYIRFWWTTNSTVEGQFNICAFESPPMIEVNTNLYTPEEIVENVLVTGCLDAFNVSYCGDNTAIGYFTSGSIVGFENGVIMGSGPVNAISGADEGDYLAAPCTTEPGIYNDMSSISASNGGSTSIYDMNVLEFDFIPSSDTTIFKFVFASEEYDSYECTAYNDVFAFFVSGPGINGPYSDSAINVALIPGTAIPITVSTINNDPTCCNGCNTYYTDVVPSEQLWVQGKTTPLNAVMSGLIPCETYHIKLVVCDAGDGVLNTFVFLEGNSFTSTGDVSMNYFSMSDSIQVALQLTGTANPAYALPAFPFFLWIPPGQNSDTVWYSAISDGLTEGTEYVIISILNACNCTFIANDTIYINDNVALQPVIAGDSIICIGQASSLGVSVNQGIDVSLVSYAWSTGDTTDIITIYPVLTQSYNVTVSVPCYGDVILSRTVEVITELPTSIFAVMSSISCYGDTLDFIYTGSATPAANYLWNFDGGTVISGSGPGPISVSWTSQGNHVITLEVSENSCTSYPTSLAISYPPPLEINISTENIICPGGQPGQVNINVSGGTGPYVYSWSSGNGTNLQPGDYTVTVTDQPGCMEIVSFTIISPNPFVYTPAYFNPLCYGYYNGSITANLSGGTPPYTYQWSHDSLGALTAASSVTGLTAGVYYLTITDDSLCYMTDTFVLSQPAQLEANIASYNNVSCFGFNDGEATVEASGGTAGYTYLWNDSLNQITEHAVNLPAGDYVVEVTDANGCFNTALAIINEPPELFSTMSGMDITCNGMNDGTLTVIASGGVSPYHYYWSPWQPNSPNLAGLPAGIYFVTTADVNLCTTGNYFTISEPEPLCLSEVVTDATSYTGSDGAIDLTVTGGIPPYIYLWSTYETTQDVYNIPPGLYIVCVSDSNGCLVLDSVQVDYLNILDLQDRLTPEVYPNPAENIIIISNLSDSEIYLYDSSGKMVKHYLCRENKFIIDISGFPDGVYRIVVFGDTVQLSNGCLFPAYSLSVCKIGKK